MAIVNANYLASRLSKEFNIYYTGVTGRVAHECIVDLQNFKADYGVDATDIAKRLMDYGFHAPTLSFPVHETLMVAPPRRYAPTPGAIPTPARRPPIPSSGSATTSSGLHAPGWTTATVTATSFQ